MSEVISEQNLYTERSSSSLPMQFEKGPGSEVTKSPDTLEDDSNDTSSILTNLPHEEVDFPEGGTKAWMVVLGAWCAMTASFGVVNASGFLQAWLYQHQLSHMSESEVSWIFSIYLFLFFFGGVQVGPIFDAYGLQFVFIPGCIGCIASLFILSVCKTYYQFLLGFGVLGGLSSTLIFTPSVTVIGHWFYKKRGFATGIACTGGACGGIMFPLAMIHLMPRVGFGWTIRVVGFIVTVLLIMSVFLVKTRIPLNKKGGAAIDLKAFKDPKFTCITIGIFMIEWALFIPITYITSYALSKGINETFAYELLAVLNAGSILGRGLPGYVADIFGRLNVMIVTTVVCAITCLAIWLPAGDNLAVIIVFAVMFGFWSGTGICLTPVCVSQVCKTEDYGKRYGTCYFFASFGVLTGLPIAGAIQSSQNGSYQGLILFSALTYLCGTFFFILARIIGGGWNIKTIY